MINHQAVLVSRPTGVAQAENFAIREAPVASPGEGNILGGMRSLNAGRAEGRLVGGNLALVAALVGTPYAWDLDGAILVLEDVSESVYRIDRMLTQLWLSGGLKRVAGLVFGQFTDIPDDAPNAERPLDRLLEEVARQCGVPTLANLALGHIDEQFTLPLGATVTIDGTACTLSYEPR